MRNPRALHPLYETLHVYYHIMYIYVYSIRISRLESWDGCDMPVHCIHVHVHT